MSERAEPSAGYLWRVLLGLGTVGVLLLFAFLFAQLFHLFLIIFGAVLVGVCLQGLTARISRHGRLPWYPSLAVSLLLLLSFLAGFAVFAGPQIVDQTTALIERIPADVQRLKTILSEYGWGRELLKRIPPVDQMVPQQENFVGRISGIFSTALGTVTNIVLVFIVGVYLAANPGIYTGGLLYLVPTPYRQDARDVVESLENALHWWLVGRITSMAVVGALTMTSLWLIDMPLPLALGLIAALLSFIPYIGPVVAAVPAILIGLSQRPLMGLYVLLVYGSIELLEGYLITPLIQQRAVSLPPALLLIAQLFMGVLFGFVGLLLATPLAVALIVLIQTIYVRKVLGEQVEVLGEHRGW